MLIKQLRKARKRMWSSQIVLGDIIAYLAGGPEGYAKRYVRKKMHKATGKRINKIKRIAK